MECEVQVTDRDTSTRRGGQPPAWQNRHSEPCGRHWPAAAAAGGDQAAGQWAATSVGQQWLSPGVQAGGQGWGGSGGGEAGASSPAWLPPSPQQQVKNSFPKETLPSTYRSTCSINPLFSSLCFTFLVFPFWPIFAQLSCSEPDEQLVGDSADGPG